MPLQKRLVESSHRLRRAAREHAESAALFVPWPRVQRAAIAYAESQAFALRVRSAREPSEEIPTDVADELRSRYPGFLERERQERHRKPAGHSVWRTLVEWIADHEFADAKREGWYDAVTYYGLNRVESMHAWAEWTRTALPDSAAPPTLPTSPALSPAVDCLLESRALLLWAAALTLPDSPLPRVVVAELAKHTRDPTGEFSPWNRAALLRLALRQDKQCTSRARSEGWFGTLRHQFRHHPRYHRLVHFCLHCQSEWRNVKPCPAPAFEQWKQACDEYFVPRPELR